MKVGVKKINLVPKEYLQAQKVRNIQLAVIAVLVLEVGGFVGKVVLPPKLEAQEVMARLDEVSAELTDSRFADVNQKIKALEDVKIELEEWNDKYKEIKEENFVSKRIIDSLLTRVPVGLSVSTLTISKDSEKEGKQIILTGTAQEAISIMNYNTIIEGVFGFGTTHEEFELDKEKGYYTYTITIITPEEVVAEETTDTTSDTTTEETVEANEEAAAEDITENAEGGDSQ